MEKHVLEKLKYFVTELLSDELITDVIIGDSYAIDDTMKLISVTVRGFVWGKDIDRIKYPRDWWQAVKERWFPRWLQKRYPVLYTAVDVKVKYPGYKYLPEDKYGPHIIFITDPHDI